MKAAKTPAAQAGATAQLLAALAMPAVQSGAVINDTPEVLQSTKIQLDANGNFSTRLPGIKGFQFTLGSVSALVVNLQTGQQVVLPTGQGWTQEKLFKVKSLSSINGAADAGAELIITYGDAIPTSYPLWQLSELPTENQAALVNEGPYTPWPSPLYSAPQASRTATLGMGSLGVAEPRGGKVRVIGSASWVPATGCQGVVGLFGNFNIGSSIPGSVARLRRLVIWDPSGLFSSNSVAYLQPAVVTAWGANNNNYSPLCVDGQTLHNANEELVSLELYDSLDTQPTFTAPPGWLIPVADGGVSFNTQLAGLSWGPEEGPLLADTNSGLFASNGSALPNGLALVQINSGSLVPTKGQPVSIYWEADICTDDAAAAPNGVVWL